jgi:hypothetical protein
MRFKRRVQGKFVSCSGFRKVVCDPGGHYELIIVDQEGRPVSHGCPHLVVDPRKLKNALYWRAAYAKLADELEAHGEEVDARQYRLLVSELDRHINEMRITQVSIEDGTRKPAFLQLASPTYDAVVIDAEA